VPKNQSRRATPEPERRESGSGDQSAERFKKKARRRVVPHGSVHIAAVVQHTQITITDTDGRVMCCSSAAPSAQAREGHAVRRAASFAGGRGPSRATSTG